ncbi:DMT family transporter [Marinomonas algicola]|uniref:DMT family transporter n=1 Tax=Marinomonas algicola TaxID=2773454 RepID=UPI001748FFF4|nr:EamA family transporter [Marinomonas algicola]
MSTFLGVLALLLWGLLALLGTLTLVIPAFQLLFMCFLISAFIMVFKRFIQHKPLFTRPSLTGPQWFIGIIGLFGFHFCYFMALQFAPAIEVSLIVYSWPLLLTLFVSTSASRLSALVGGILGFLGIACIVLKDSQINMEEAFLWGYLLSAICAGIWSSYSWFLSKSKSHVDDIGWLSLGVAMLAFAAHLQFETGQWELTWHQWVGVLLLGLGPVGGAFYLWDMGLKYGNRSLLASLSFSTPALSSFILSTAGLNPWSFNIIIALSLIAIGAIIANKNLLGFLQLKRIHY